MLIYTQRETNIRDLPNIRAYIDKFRDRITCKEVAERKHSIYALHRARDEKIFLKKKKVVGVITEDEIVLAIDERQTFATDGIYLFGLNKDVSAEYVVGVLNSDLFVFVYRLLAIESGRVLAQVKPTVLAQLPIRRSHGSSTHDQIVALVKQREDIQSRLAEAKTPAEITSLERHIFANHSQLNDLVYALYDLSTEQVKTILDSSSRRATE